MILLCSAKAKSFLLTKHHCLSDLLTVRSNCLTRDIFTVNRVCWINNFVSYGKARWGSSETAPLEQNCTLRQLRRFGHGWCAIWCAFANKCIYTLEICGGHGVPCYLCISGLKPPSQSLERGTHDESFQMGSLPQIEILDKGLGVWKVLLSPRALRSVLLSSLSAELPAALTLKEERFHLFA